MPDTPETRSFPIADVLTITTGVVLGSDGGAGIYKILNYLTGDNLYTHQLARASHACRPQILAQHPWLETVQPPAGIDVPGLLSWLAGVESMHPQVVLSPITGWQHRDPIEEAVELVGPDRVIPVVMGDA